MENLVHIKSSFSCVLAYLSTQKNLDKDRIYTFILKDKTTLSFYPNNDNISSSLPFSCEIDPDCENLIKTGRNNITVTRFPNNNFLIEISPFVFTSTPTMLGLKTKTIKTQNITHTITYFSNNNLNFRIENNNSYLDFSNNCKVIDLNIKAKNDNIFLYFQTKNTKYFTCLINYQNNKYLLQETSEVDLLEEQDNIITTYKNLQDFASHGEIVTYNFDNEFSITRELAYNNPTPYKTKVKEFVPYAFFEALKVNNFKLARYYLTPKLSNKLSNNHLKKFFGNFEKAHQTLSPNFNPEEIALIYYGKQLKYAKLFSIKYDEENKISNIEEA